MTSRCPVCRNEGRNRTCHPAEDEVSRANVAPTDPRVPADTSAPQLLRDALYDLHTHSHQPPNGADMPIEYVAFRDVEDLFDRAVIDAPALTVERLRNAMEAAGVSLGDERRYAAILRALGEGVGEGVDRG